MMQELYESWVADGNALVEQTRDPYWDPPEDIFLGSVYIYLQSLAYHLDISENLSITNYQGETEGKLQITLCPCDTTGRPLTDAPTFVGTPNELLGQRMDLLIRIKSAKALSWIQGDGTRGVSCRYKFYTDSKMRSTKCIEGEVDPSFDYTKQFTIKSVSHNFVNYLEHNALVVEVWGKQGSGKPTAAPSTATKKGNVTAADGSGATGAAGLATTSNNGLNGDQQDISSENVLSEAQWRSERVYLLQQIEDLQKEVDFLTIEKGQLEKEMTRITLASESFMQSADSLSKTTEDNEKQYELPVLVQSLMKEDEILRERLEEFAKGSRSQAELKSLTKACEKHRDEVSRIIKDLETMVKATQEKIANLAKLNDQNMQTTDI
jgi:hypothetical protein